MGDAAGRVLVLAPNWLGDAVMAVPAIADVRRHWPDRHLAVAARPKLAPFFEWVPGVDAVVRLQDPTGLAPQSQWNRAAALLGARRRDAQVLAEGRFEVVVLFTNSFRTAWLARRAAIPERWGYRRDGRGLLLTRAVRRPRGARRHMTEYYQELTAALGMANWPRVARVEAPAEGRARARTLLAARGWREGYPIVGMAPGAAYGHAKRWLPERFAELALALSEAGITSILVGARGDAGAGQEIERALKRAGRGAGGGERAPAPASRQPVVNLIGQTDLPTLAGVMAECQSFVSNDSGAMHLAAALGVSVAAIFGASDEHHTSPLPYAEDAPGVPAGRHVILTNPVWCRPCMLRECPIDHRCMTGVSAEAVLTAVMQHVRRPADDTPAPGSTDGSRRQRAADDGQEGTVA